MTKEIFDLNRNPELGPWFKQQLTELVQRGYYHNNINRVSDSIIAELADYRVSNNIDTVVVGLSGGIDSAVTALLFNKAGYKVIGVIMSIHQNPEEEQRAIELCRVCGIEFLRFDLTADYEILCSRMVTQFDTFLLRGIRRADAIRRGNIRARLRMMTLYNIAAMNNGFVASTDNFSELAAGFWTLHGDVGDVAPIQSLTKSWEVPKLAQHLGVPESIVKAKPTDGLGIANGDEDQLGVSYLEFDIGVLTLLGQDADSVLSKITNESDRNKMKVIMDRVKNSAHKRRNPYNLNHPSDQGRFDQLQGLDRKLLNTTHEE